MRYRVALIDGGDNDLALAINTLGEELAGSETNPNAAEFMWGWKGRRDLHPILRDESTGLQGGAT